MATQIAMFEPVSGRELRDAGMFRVADHNSEWAAKAGKLIDERFDEFLPYSLFTGEDFHDWLQSKGIEEPEHPNAWSAVIGSTIRRWLKEGRVESAGAINAVRPSAHARLIRRYRKVR